MTEAGDTLPPATRGRPWERPRPGAGVSVPASPAPAGLGDRRVG